MKGLLFVSAALLLHISANADGELTFDNNLASLVTLYNGSRATANQGYSVELFEQPDMGGSAPTPIGPSGVLGNWQAIATTGILPIPGIFNGGIVTIPGVNDNAPVWLQVVGWSGNQPNFETALAQPTPELIGYSTVWSEQTADPSLNPPPTPPPLFSQIGGFTGLDLEPVPDATSTLALSVISALALVFIRKSQSAIFQ